MIDWLSTFGRRAAIAATGALLLVLALLGWAILSPAPKSRPSSPLPPSTGVARTAPSAARPSSETQGDCASADVDRLAVAANADSVEGATWSPFGRAERGWRTYARLVQREIGTRCAPETPGFARALGAWKARQAVAGGGALDEAAFRRMSTNWLLRRPFVQATRHGGCPASPPVDALQDARPEEGYAGKQVAALAPALFAYRRMVASARAESREIAVDTRLLTIFSAYRGPDEEAAKCANGGCNGLTKARCSAHRTGTAFDLFVGAAPGARPESSDDANRRVQAASPAYGWLVANADRFGFLPYPFEPWHWEWAGAPPARSAQADASVAAQRTPRMNAQSVR